VDVATIAWCKPTRTTVHEDKISWWPEESKELYQLYFERFINGLFRTYPVNHNFHLFTNHPEWFKKWSKLCNIIPFEAKYKRITNKFIVYDPLYPLSEHMILLDLDTIFKSPWEEYTTDYDGLVMMNNTNGCIPKIKGEWSPGGGIIMTGQRTKLFDRITKPLYENPDKVYEESTIRERVWFAKQIGIDKIDYWQRDKPGSVVSYKKDYNKGRDGALIWCHGRPRPHQIPETSELRQKYWL